VLRALLPTGATCRSTRRSPALRGAELGTPATWRNVCRAQIADLSGTPPKRFVIISFDGIDKTKAWYNSPAQEEINGIR
jgi:hypothetical protein